MVDSTDTQPQAPRKSPNPRKPASPDATIGEPAKNAATRPAPTAEAATNSTGRDWKAEADKLENKTDKSGIKRNLGLLYLHYYLPFCMSALYIFQCLVGLIKWKYLIHYRNNCSRFYK